MHLTSKLLHITHGFFLRDGSTAENVCSTLGATKLVTAKQIHSNIAMYVDKEGLYECDALVTTKPGIAVGVYTADCGPVLLSDKRAGIVAALHAGWRGARFGIIESTVRLMRDLGAEDIAACVGPCIHQKSYEVSAEFLKEFFDESEDNARFFIPSQKQSHFMFALPEYIHDKLKRNGVDDIEVLQEDTLSQPHKFSSYRRGTLNGVKELGRQISAVVI